MLKRVSAFIFDFVLLITLIVGVALLLSAVVGYDAKVSEMESLYAEYSEKYGVNVGITAEGYESLTESERKTYEEAQKAFSEDPRAVNSTNLVMNLTLMIVTLSFLISYLILEFAVPLFLKNGQTVGKKIFGIALMRDDGVKVTPVMLFVRSILGKCTIETLVPIFIAFLILLGNAGIVGLLAILLLFVFEIGLIVKTNTNSCIHDILAYTVAVDFESQMIFDSKEDLIAYKEKIHAERVENEKEQ